MNRHLLEDLWRYQAIHFQDKLKLFTDQWARPSSNEISVVILGVER